LYPLRKSKWQWATSRALIHTLLVLCFLFGSAVIISNVALSLGWQALSTHTSKIHVTFMLLLVNNCFVVTCFYLAGFSKSRVYYIALLLVNLFVWSLALSLLIPWLRSSATLVTCKMFTYIFIEVYAYTLAASLGWVRIKSIVPFYLILIAAILELSL
jgi:hypothetical protein